MLKKIIFIVILIALPFIAETLAEMVSMEMIMDVFYVILGIGFLYIVKEELVKWLLKME